MTVTHSEDLPWNPGRHTTECGKRRFSGESIRVDDVALAERSLDLGLEVGRRTSRVKHEVLARGLARVVNESRAQADGLLWVC